MPLPATGGAVREARSGNVHQASESEERGRSGRYRSGPDGGVADTSLEKQKEGERRRRGRKEREKEEKKGENMESFFCSVFEFLMGPGFD